jgi:hypothetical protein
MRVLVIILLVISISYESSIGQKDNLWLLGYASFGGPPFGNMNMLFSQNNLDSINFYYRNMNFEFTNASICDSSGNLLFYTNGVYIANAQDDTMLNGSGLNPSWYTTQFYYVGLRIMQGNIIIPRPGSDSLFYLLHESIDFPGWVNYRPGFLYKTIVDIKGDNGLGEVISKNDIIIQDTLTLGALTVCRHANGRDWWLLLPVYGSEVTYNSYLITPDTIVLVQSQVYPINGLEGGTANFSPDGTKYIWYNCYGVAFFDFDRCSGILTLHDNIDYFADSICWIGSSISPNSQYAYISHGEYIFQFDLQAPNIAASLDTVAVNDGYADPNPPFYTQFVLHQLAPDGKIYINHGNGTLSLHVIDQPDSAGVACNVLQHAVPLPRFNVTIPNFPNYNLGRLQGSPCDTLQWTGFDEMQHDFRFRIYPNPVTNNSLHIGYLLPQNKNGTFQIYDITGKVVFKYPLPPWSNEQELKLPQLANGIYNASIISDNKRVSKTIAIMNE